VTFALLFGPGLLHAIQRFTRRLQVRWVAPGTAFPLLGAAIALLAVSLPAPGPARAAAPAGSPAGYLSRAQNADGGFGAAPGQASDPLFSGWAALGLASAHIDPLRPGPGGRSVIGYIRAHGVRSLDTGSLERTILVVGAAGLPAQTFGGDNLANMLEGRRGRNGAFGGTVNLTAFAILALRSVGLPAPATSVRWLIRQPNADGGYGFAGAGSASDSDDTGAVLEALAGQPGAAAARARAVGYLRGHQGRDGGFAAQPGMGSNAQSTAWAVQGLVAAGVNPGALHRRGAQSPVAYLRSLIGANGAVAYAHGQNQTPVWVTAQALMALEQRPLPLPAMALPAPHRATPGPVGSAAARRHGGRARARLGHHTRRHQQRHSARRPTAPKTGALQHEVLRLAGEAGVTAAALLAPVGVG
jgi:energy-coupling factor transport system substrate-specific component